MATFNVNTDALVVLTNRLEKLHRSDFPIAVRNTLTKAALLTKTESLQRISKQSFTNRNKTFFRAKSKFAAARGFNVSSMKATVGMVDIRVGSGDHAVRNLEKQEHGGSIGGRSFVPTDRARVSRSPDRNVAPRNRLSRISIRDVVRSRLSKGKNRHQRFVKSVIQAHKQFGSRGLVLHRNILFRVDNVTLNRKGRRLRFKLTPLYSYRKNRAVTVKATNFMKRSTLVQAQKLGILYKIEAEKRFKKARL